jgi:hypothetical protein
MNQQAAMVIAAVAAMTSQGLLTEKRNRGRIVFTASRFRLHSSFATKARGPKVTAKKCPILRASS